MRTKVKIINKHLRIIFFLSLAGILLSSYMVYYHYSVRNNPSSTWCNINSFINCDNILLSSYSEIAGIPLGVFGAIWFLINVGISFFVKDKNILFIWCMIGLAFVLFLVSAELLVLHSICLLCTGVHILVTAIFITCLLYIRKN
ncbi:MAG: vitamin K epoxide reductase family protein [Candidatus Aenigmarchaeota archaeon]|nr:vitamin K epoxide reductase family protein [Candidatus Aenigmarchaeota archaeon]